MAGAKRKAASKKAVARGKKRSRTIRSPSRRSPTPAPSAAIRRVERSNAETTTEVAERLGVSIATVRRRAQRGELRAVISADGHYHFPRAPSPARRPAKKPPFRKKRSSTTQPPSKKKRVRSSAAASPTPTRSTKTTPRKKTGVRKTKKRASKKKLAKKRRPAAPPPPPRKRRKKKAGKRKAAKKIRIRLPRPPPPEPPLPPGYVRNPFGGPPIPGPDYEPPPTPPGAPMPIGTAAQQVGHVMNDFVRARLKDERELTYQDFRAIKHAFRVTYGLRAWRRTFEWIVDEWDLESYIFDREALRDS